MSGFQHDIAGGQGNLIITALQSPNFLAGVTGWQVAKDGSAEFNNLTIRGQFLGTDFIINSSGAFFYSPSIGAGNLIASIASAFGTDAYGNTYLQGITVYGPSMSGVQLLPGAVPQVVLYPGGWTIAQVWPSLFAAIAGTGTTAERYAFNLISGYPSSGSAAYQTSIYGQGAAADGSADGYIQAVVASAAGSLVNAFKATATQMITALTVTAQQPGSGSGTAETWHTITLDAGWTAGPQPPQYRMLPDGNVQVRGQATHAGTTAAVNINGTVPLPAAYRPAQTRFYRAPDAGDTAGTVQIATTGVFAMRASGFTATQVIMEGDYSLL